jgi:AraC-like DNA-binding protein
MLGRSFVHFWPRPHLAGVALFGAPDEDDLSALTRLLRLELAAGAPRHVSLVDAHRIERVDPMAFAALQRYVDEHRTRLVDQVERLAIVRPAGVLGATVSGFFHVAVPPYPVGVFDGAREALDFLDEPDEGFLAELDRALADATCSPSWLVTLRKKLDSRPGRLAIEDAAKTLAMSVRTLQRQLKTAGTTYQREVAASQVRVAERLLRETSSSLGAVAVEIGCVSQQHFSTLFKRLTGESPSTYRTRTRAGRR